MSSNNAKPIVVKVMRLVKPFFEVDNIDPMDNIALPGFNSLFSLPQAFGTIYLGQKFSAYVSVINKSNVEMKDMVVQVELKSSTQRYILPDEQLSYQQREEADSAPLRRDIGPGKSYYLIVQKSMLELGEHIISVLINYLDPYTNKQESVKKNFKFMVEKPVDIVISNIPLNKREQFIHLGLTNTTQSFITIDSIEFKSNDQVIVKEAESQSSQDPNLTKVAPDALYSATFHIQCADTQRMDLPSEIGCFSIKWSDEQGEQGFLQTCPIHSEVIDQSPLVLSYTHLPSSIQVLQPVSLEFCLKNMTANNYEISLDWTTIESNIRILGEFSHHLSIHDHETITIPVQFLPVKEGEFKMPSPKVLLRDEDGNEVQPTFNSTYILIQ